MDPKHPIREPGSLLNNAVYSTAGTLFNFHTAIMKLLIEQPRRVRLEGYGDVEVRSTGQPIRSIEAKLGYPKNTEPDLWGTLSNCLNTAITFPNERIVFAWQIQENIPDNPDLLIVQLKNMPSDSHAIYARLQEVRDECEKRHAHKNSRQSSPTPPRNTLKYMRHVLKPENKERMINIIESTVVHSNETLDDLQIIEHLSHHLRIPKSPDVMDIYSEVQNIIIKQFRAIINAREKHKQSGDKSRFKPDPIELVYDEVFRKVILPIKRRILSENQRKIRDPQNIESDELLAARQRFGDIFLKKFRGVIEDSEEHDREELEKEASDDYIKHLAELYSLELEGEIVQFSSPNHPSDSAQFYRSISELHKRIRLETRLQSPRSTNKAHLYLCTRTEIKNRTYSGSLKIGPIKVSEFYFSHGAAHRIADGDAVQATGGQIPEIEWEMVPQYPAAPTRSK